MKVHQPSIAGAYCHAWQQITTDEGYDNANA
jgi:hypothetical protein